VFRQKFCQATPAANKRPLRQEELNLEKGSPPLCCGNTLRWEKRKKPPKRFAQVRAKKNRRASYSENIKDTRTYGYFKNTTPNGDVNINSKALIGNLTRAD
jgi:hypothetical protein